MSDFSIIYPKPAKAAAYWTGDYNHFIVGDPRVLGTKSFHYSSGNNSSRFGCNCHQYVDGNRVRFDEYKGNGIEVQQVVDNKNGVSTKITDVGRAGCSPRAKSVQILDNETGRYSVARMLDGEVVGGYEANTKPAAKKFATGFKGRLQKFALNIASDSNGCERPVLKNVGAVLFNLAKRIK